MDITFIIDIIGTIAFAISGYFIAIKNKLDLLGVIILSYITAFGGGIIRDVIAQRESFVFTSNYYIGSVFLVLLLLLLIKGKTNEMKILNSKLFIISDSLGLSIFSVTGAQIAIEKDLNLGGTIFLAFITAVGGGIIRDLIINKIPFVLTNEFYGTIAIIIGISAYYLNVMGTFNDITYFLLILFGFLLRIFAIKYNWKLPTICKN